jgi:hypothetical protein
MLEGHKGLTLALLNEATQAWVELEYNRALHSEIGETPLRRFLAGPVTTGHDGPRNHRNHRGPGTHPVVLRQFFARADSAKRAQG